LCFLFILVLDSIFWGWPLRVNLKKHPIQSTIQPYRLNRRLYMQFFGWAPEGGLNNKHRIKKTYRFFSAQFFGYINPKGLYIQETPYTIYDSIVPLESSIVYAIFWMPSLREGPTWSGSSSVQAFALLLPWYLLHCYCASVFLGCTQTSLCVL